MSRPQLDMIKSAVAPNKPFFLDDIEIGTQADRPAGEGWVFVEFLIHERATRWTRRRPIQPPSKE